MTPTRVAVIGTGTMGDRHCRVYSGLHNVQLVGVTDLNGIKAQNIADYYNTKCFWDYDNTLLSQVDAISIATPTTTHYDLAMKALQAGVHVLIEKPIANDILEAKILIERAERGNLILQVGHIERFNPTYIELKNVITDRNLIAVTIRRLSPFDTSNTDVDVIKDLMIHDLDLIVDLLGCGPNSITARGRCINGDLDHVEASLSFNDGPIVTLIASRVTEQKVRTIEIVANGAYIEADLMAKSILIHRRTFPEYQNMHYRQESVIERIHVPMQEPLALELRQFIDSVRQGCNGGVTGNDGLRALRLAERVREQIK